MWGWKGRLALAMAVAGCWSALGPTPGAIAGPGDLDPSFGNRGIALKPLAFDGRPPRYFYGIEVQETIAPDGGILVSGLQEHEKLMIVRFTPDGRLDRSFAQQGVLRVDPPGENPLFQTSRSWAIDSAGRIVVAGTVAQVPTLMRYEPDGALDPSFGGGGGLAQPALPLRRPSYWETNPDSFTISGVAVDPAGRIVLAGSAQRFYGICIVQSFGFVARLGDSGELDPAFGEGGAVSFSSDQLSSANDLVLDGNGNPLVFGESEACRSQSTSTLLRLASNGPAQTLLSGRAGFSQLAIDSSGRILGLEVGRRNVVIRRLQTNGGADPSFGTRGSTRLPKPSGSSIGGLAIAPDGSLVIVATVRAGRARPHRQPRRWLSISRLRPGGRLDRRFGRRGTATARLGSLTGRAVTVDRSGRAIAAGTVQDPRLVTDQGIALLAFELGG